MANTATPNPSMEALLVAARALAQCEHDMTYRDEDGSIYTCPEREPGRTLQELRDWLGYAPATRESQVLVDSLTRLRAAGRLLVHGTLRQHTRASGAAAPEPLAVDHHRDVRCDACGVCAEKPCRGKSGERVSSHLARVRASQALRERCRMAAQGETIAAGWKQLLVSFQQLGLR